MTADAGGRFVRPCKRKLGFLVVIEGYRFPVVRLMTAFAFRAVLTAVHIVQPMARDALGRDLLILLVRVAAVARDVAMSTIERKFRLAVIEFPGAP